MKTWPGRRTRRDTEKLRQTHKGGLWARSPTRSKDMAWQEDVSQCQACLRKKSANVNMRPVAAVERGEDMARKDRRVAAAYSPQGALYLCTCPASFMQY